MKFLLLALFLAGCSQERPVNRWNESPEDLEVREAIERINSPEDESAPEGSRPEYQGDKT